MKITKLNPVVKTAKPLIIAFDVSKNSLNYYSELQIELLSGALTQIHTLEDSFKNSTKLIEEHLKNLDSFAKKNGFSGLHVVCESTGPYNFKLLSIARKLGHTTAYVSGEAVHKYHVVESNDSGKTDPKDARVIFLLAKMEKTLLHRELEGEYKQLRELNRIYDYAQSRITSTKCQLHALLQRLFCDYSFEKDFLYSSSGKALIQLFKCNPYRIVEVGKELFSEQMKTLAPLIKKESLERLFENATHSVLHEQEKCELEVMEYRLEMLYQEYELYESKRSTIKEKMAQIYNTLLEKGENVPRADKEFCNEFRIARILGETGRISDFKSIQQLWKYGGLNLREKKSGNYVGQVRLSKKGRSSLRLILGEIAFKLVRKHEVFGEYYHQKKERGVCGTKILAAVERKLLKAFYGMAKKREGLNKERLFCCESEYKKAS